MLQAVFLLTPISLSSSPLWSISVIVVEIYSEFIPTDPCCSGARWMACKVNGSDPIFPCSTPHPTHMHTHTYTHFPHPTCLPITFSISYTMQNSIRVWSLLYMSPNHNGYKTKCERVSNRPLLVTLMCAILEGPWHHILIANSSPTIGEEPIGTAFKRVLV